MRILVTGGAGFIGSHVVDAYIDLGHDVHVLDDLSTGNLANVNPKARPYKMDIRSPELGRLLEEIRPEVVNHHAAQKSVPTSVLHPELDADINIMGVINVVNAVVASGVRRFIFASSGGALASSTAPPPTRETDEPSLISPYAIHKFTAEKYLEFYARTHGMHYVVLRYANVYGPRQIADGDCGVVPIFVENILQGRPSRLFAYADMPRGTTRDYVYITDVVRANVLALSAGANGVYNIGTGQEVYTEELYYAVRKAMGSDLPLLREQERPGDVRRSALDCSRAAEALKWRPMVDLEKGLEQMSRSYASAET